MNPYRFRTSLTVLATVLFLGLSFSSTPSDTAILDRHELPARDDAADLQDLARWMVSGGQPIDRQFHVVLPEDFAAAVQPEPQQISLFQLGPDLEARRRVLSGLPYGTVIARAAERHRVDGLLLAAIVAVESRFAPDAVSPRGAMGLMQVRAAVGEAYGAGDLFDPYANIDVGSRYLASLLAEYKGDLELTLAAYNAGPATVARYGGLPPYRETREYVRRVLSRYREYTRHAEEAGESPLLGSRNALTGV